MAPEEVVSWFEGTFFALGSILPSLQEVTDTRMQTLALITVNLTIAPITI